MNFTEDQWLALKKLRRIRQNTNTTVALREVLVEGGDPQAVAAKYGLTHQCVYNAISRSRETMRNARVLAGAPEL